MLPDDRYRRAAAAGGVGIWDWNIVTGEVYIDPRPQGDARLPGRRDPQHGGRLASAGASRRQGRVGRMDPGQYRRRSSPIRVRASDASSRRQRPMVSRACLRDTRRAWGRHSHGRNRHGHHGPQAGRRSPPAGGGNQQADRGEHRRLREDPRSLRPNHLHQSRRPASARARRSGRHC